MRGQPQKNNSFGELPLSDGETILWQGRPAPRAFTFRNWRHALFGLALLLPCLLWQIAGIEVAKAGAAPWVAWLPLPFNLGALYLSFGQLLVARLEWEKVFYALTDRALYQQRGLFRPRLAILPRERVSSVRKKILGPNLATVRIDGQGGETIILWALEHPELLLQHLSPPEPF